MPPSFVQLIEIKQVHISWYAGQAAENEGSRLISEERSKPKRSGMFLYKSMDVKILRFYRIYLYDAQTVNVH